MALFYRFVRAIQLFVDSKGMYRIVSGGLAILALISIISGGFGWLSYGAVDQSVALACAVGTALACSFVIARVRGIHIQYESSVITALILFFLIIPGETFFENWMLVFAVAIGICSKYVVVYAQQHIFNPAAFGAFALSATGVYDVTWWVSNPTLVFPVVGIGVLVVMKVRKWAPVIAFIMVGASVFLVESLRFGDAPYESLILYFISWPTLFFAFFMLTEPFTLPSRTRTQVAYGAGVGALMNTTMFTGVFAMTPELALLIGNLCAIRSRLYARLLCTLRERRLIARDTYEYVFDKPPHFSFEAGQYMEWMVPHVTPDAKGIRRYFTVASSPTEHDVRIAMRVPEQASSFKLALQALQRGSAIRATQRGGDFVLPSGTEKIGYIAGGIGITPFRSHIQYMLDTRMHHDTVLMYCVNTQDDIAYKALFETASSQMTFTPVYVVAHEQVLPPYEQGFLTLEILARRVPDFAERRWYISGPPAMVARYTTLLRSAGVPRRHIAQDFFAGAV